MRFLLKYLAGKQAIADVLSSDGFGVKLYMNRAPKNCPLPMAVLTVIGGNPDYSLDGELGDLAKTVQIDVYADDEAKSEEIAELIRLAPLSGYRGLMGDVEVESVTIARESTPDDYRDDGSDTPYARSSRDYRVHFHRAVTTT